MSAAKKTLARVEASKKGRWFVLRSLDGSDFAFRLFADGFKVNDEVVITLAAQAQVVDPLSVACPKCCADAGAPCSDSPNFPHHLLTDCHEERRKDAARPIPLEERVKQLTETAAHLRGQVEKLILAQPPVAMVERVKLLAEAGRRLIDSWPACETWETAPEPGLGRTAVHRSLAGDWNADVCPVCAFRPAPEKAPIRQPESQVQQ